LYADSVFLLAAGEVTPKNPVLPPTHHYWVNALVGLVLLAAIIVGVVLLLRRRSPSTSVTAEAEALLANRFARGEIDETEYEQRRETLRA
jgi:putative membrane protein